MKRLFPIFLLVALAFGCSDTSQNANQNPNSNEEQIAVIPTSEIILEVEGMVCEMGCGGAIRTALMETMAVSECGFDFEHGRETNFATIAFDEGKISSDKIMQMLGQLNDGQFNIRKLEMKSVVPKQDSEEQKKLTASIREEQLKNIQSNSSTLELPNFVEILASFFHN